MVSMSVGAVSVLVAALLALTLPVLLVWLVVKAIQLIAWILGSGFAIIRGGTSRITRFVRSSIVDALHLVGGVLTATVIAPLAVVNVCIGRWSAAGHYGRALEDELMGAGLCMYRLALGNPIKLLGLTALTDGLERRLPDLVSRAPQRELPRNGKKAFEGYRVVGTLAPGGSGARLYLAKPVAAKVSEFTARGLPTPDKVVIKSFAVEEGSTLPQILRESRALECANRLGLVLEHELSDRSFHYVMPYVPGDGLDSVIRRMHSLSTPEGLSDKYVKQIVSYSTDMLRTLDHFHAGGLWHKDIKPSNLIVSDDRVHIVDLGLVTPLESGMTLTTHGTEYFRDPELVRLALRGVKVHEVDGVKFDLYSAGAVLYSMVEDSFPAHGSLSAIKKRCPNALQWIIRRAMSDLNTRYGSAREMLRDLVALRDAKDPFAVVPADLPSMQSGDIDLKDESFGLSSTPGPTSAFHRAAAASAAPSTPNYPAAPPTAVHAVRKRHQRRTARRMAGVAVVAAISLIALRGMSILARTFDASQLDAAHPSNSYPSETQPQRVANRSARAAEQPDFAPIAKQLPKLRGRLGAGHILLLEDLLLSVDAATLDELERSLNERGYRVLGAGLGDDSDEREIMLIAGARKAAGLSGPDDPAAADRLEEYLNQSRALDGILWLAPGQERGALSYRLILRGEPAYETATIGLRAHANASNAEARMIR